MTVLRYVVTFDVLPVNCVTVAVGAVSVLAYEVMVSVVRHVVEAAVVTVAVALRRLSAMLTGGFSILTSPW